MKESNILLVDDDEFVLSGIGTEIKGEGYKVTTAKSTCSRQTGGVRITDAILALS